MLGRGPKRNLKFNVDTTNHCGWCNKRIRDWKLFCNQLCYNSSSHAEQEAFDKAEDDDQYNSFYLTECQRWEDHAGFDGEVQHPSTKRKWREECSEEDHHHPKLERCEEEFLESLKYSELSELKKD